MSKRAATAIDNENKLEQSSLPIDLNIVLCGERFAQLDESTEKRLVAS